MKGILVFVCLSSYLTIAFCLLCKVAEDCDKLNKPTKDNEPAVNDFCCMAADSNALLGKGLCLRLSREGKICHQEDAKFSYYGDKYLTYCPCKNGLKCSPKVDKNFTDPALTRRNLACKIDDTTTAAPVVVKDGDEE